MKEHQATHCKSQTVQKKGKQDEEYDENWDFFKII